MWLIWSSSVKLLNLGPVWFDTCYLQWKIAHLIVFNQQKNRANKLILNKQKYQSLNQYYIAI